MAKDIRRLLREMGASRGGPPPIRDSAATMLEEKAIVFSFGAMFMVKSLKRLKKARSLMGFKKA